MKKIRTTNMMERIKGTEKKKQGVGAFPNQESVLRLQVSIPIDINENWITVNKYIVMEM